MEGLEKSKEKSMSKIQKPPVNWFKRSGSIIHS